MAFLEGVTFGVGAIVGLFIVSFAVDLIKGAYKWLSTPPKKRSGP